MKTEYEMYKEQYDAIFEKRHQAILDLLSTQRVLCSIAFEREWKEPENTFESIRVAIQEASKPNELSILGVVKNGIITKELVSKEQALKDACLALSSQLRQTDWEAKYKKCIDVIKRFDAGIIGMYDL